MKASYRWLKSLVPGLSASPHELAERFTRTGLEVESVTEFGVGEGVFVAEVRAIEPHPTRDKLRLVTVDRGGALQRVVCGAPNVPEPGGLVALAVVGATLPAVGMTLTPRAIGGVESEGMLCSERELGLSSATKADADPGILILPKGLAKPGTPLGEALPGAHDFIFEISVTPNRPDALGHVGLARDAAALYGLPFSPPQPDAPARVAATGIDALVRVEVEDVERCPHYGAAAVLDVTLGPSPSWLRYRLESLGIRPISNVVDVTNLVLLEFGQPMHAFDLDLVRGNKIVVRRAAAGEPMKTLDGEARTLDADDLVIADGEGPVALAGVMGGENSEIRLSTKRVLLECAYFWPRGVRRSSRRHGLHTESSHRFERGVDPGAVPDVLAHAASLLTSLAGGAAAHGLIFAGTKLKERAPIALRSARMDALLGAPVPFDEALAILARLGCTMRSGAGEGKGRTADVVPPTHRPDLEREADLIEEVLRVRGVDTVPAKLPAIRKAPPRKEGVIASRARAAAIGVGLSEAMTYSFVSPEEIAALGLPPATVRLKNPLTEDRSVMRPSLLPGLLQALSRAVRHGQRNVRLFTVGARFFATGDENALPDEWPTLAAVVCGARDAVLEKPSDIDVYDAKGLALEMAERVTNRRATAEPQPAERRAPYLHPRAAGDVLIEGVLVGAFGVLHPDVVDKLDLGSSCVVIELDLRALEAVGVRTNAFVPIPSLPATTRDIALVVHDDVTAGAVASAIREAAGELCESVEVFDLFRGGSIPADHRSLAYHVVYRDPKAAKDPDAARTLTDEEVDKQHASVVSAVQKRFGAVLRG